MSELVTEHDIKDPSLATGGRYRIEWAEKEMPVLRAIMKRFEEEKPLKGVKVSACLHVTTETANLMRTLQAGGAGSITATANVNIVPIRRVYEHWQEEEASELQKKINAVRKTFEGYVTIPAMKAIIALFSQRLGRAFRSTR